MLAATEEDDTVKAITPFLYFYKRSDAPGNHWRISPPLLQNTRPRVSGEEEGDVDAFKRPQSTA